MYWVLTFTEVVTNWVGIEGGSSLAGLGGVTKIRSRDGLCSKMILDDISASRTRKYGVDRTVLTTEYIIVFADIANLESIYFQSSRSTDVSEWLFPSGPMMA